MPTPRGIDRATSWQTSCVSLDPEISHSSHLSVLPGLDALGGLAGGLGGVGGLTNGL